LFAIHRSRIHTEPVIAVNLNCLLSTGLEYIQNQDPEILKLRIEIMIKENCEEFALNLCNWSLKHPSLGSMALEIKEFQIFILYKQTEFGKMQEVVSVFCLLSYRYTYICLWYM